MKERLALIMTVLLCILFLGGYHYMTINTASPNPKLPPYPVTMFPAGRFMLPTPRDTTLVGGTFIVNKITIEEIPWKSGRNREEL